MENSILTSTKKSLGIDSNYDAFDLDIITPINSTLAIVSQLGVGPEEGFTIEDDMPEWSELGIPQNQLNLVRTYVFLRVRLIFDPPTTSFHIEAMNKQIQEYEQRLSYLRENLIPLPVEEVIVDDWSRPIY